MGHRRGIPLRDRPVDPAPDDPAPRRGAQTRHCWVDGPPDHPGPWPGVIVEWRLADDGWSALVVYVVTEGPSSTTVHTRLPARFLRPAPTSSPLPGASTSAP